MKRIALAAAAIAVLATPAAAALKPGDKAPNFTAPGYLAGDPVQLSLAEALKKGPVVLYFFPSAYTKGCNLEAHLFSEAADQFKAQKATVIGVTAGAVDRLAQFSKDTEHCGGKFAVAADPGAKIARSYDSVLTVKPDWSDRTSYVIAPNGTILHAYSKLDPSQHVEETLGAVKAYNIKRK
ncbi:peroxiredoxin [Phenylobacterium sp.]|uniref:peroxiredoxin n=1 Tax=Phenylobacterium sp. TaxID=1871053 RepID=UPI0025FEEDCA|nr:peroxiredoxin [Phenylobacterium sp.]MBX3482267.1 peroxiredoxin [Phenylobacterium sp.]MCW5772491.1 peroxiredoxin [Rhodospirillaceae bacterium]